MLRELGYSIAIYPTTALLAVANAAVTALRGIGGSHAVPLPMSRMEDFFRVVGLDEWFAVSERWSGPVPEQRLFSSAAIRGRGRLVEGGGPGGPAYWCARRQLSHSRANAWNGPGAEWPGPLQLVVNSRFVGKGRRIGGQH
jgi:hypothetical protein